MPFKSQAQIRKFHELRGQGKMSQETIDKWMSETPNINKLPERLKQATLPEHEGKKFFIYRNINKGKDQHIYSLKAKEDNRVKGHANTFFMQGAKFKVSKAGKDRVRSEGVKNVHAGVEGTIISEPSKVRKWTPVTYDPKKYDSFVRRDTLEPVDSADILKFTPQGVFMKTAIFKEFVKFANKKLQIISLGKDKGIKILKGSTHAQKQRLLRAAAMRQPIVDLASKGIAKANNISKGKAKDMVLNELRYMTLGGTISKGKKGTRSYIDPEALKKVFKDPKKSPSLRNIIHHEEFHRRVPILGQSELLAHTWGGLNQTKGPRYKNIGQAGRDLKMLFQARPGRALMETAAVGGAGIGAGIGAVQLGKKAFKREEDPNLIQKTANGDMLEYYQQKEKLKGGLGDNKKDSDFIASELKKGIKVEKEHTKSLSIAKEVAKDHLTEHPKYYSALKKMEDGLKKKASEDKTLYQPKPSTREGKKYQVYVKGESGNPKLIHFGAKGYKHNYSEGAKKNFRARHGCEGASKDTPKWWACNYLWGTDQKVGTSTNTKLAFQKLGALINEEKEKNL
jgi:hypothetical protein